MTWTTSSELPRENTVVETLDSELKDFLKGPVDDLWQYHATETSVAASSKRCKLSKLDDLLQTITGNINARSGSSCYSNSTRDRLTKSRDARSHASLGQSNASLDWVVTAIDCCRKGCFGQKPVFSEASGISTVPIFDVSALRTDTLRSLFCLFTTPVQNSNLELLSRTDLITTFFNEFVPRVPVDDPMNDSTATSSSSSVCCDCRRRPKFFRTVFRRQKICSVCRRELCLVCSKQQRHISGRQSSLAVPVCTECSLTLDKTETNKWMQQSRRLLLQENKTSFTAACGCVAMAICSSNDWTSVLLSLTKHLIQNNWPEMGLRLIAPLLVNKNVSSKDYVKSLMLLASALEKSFARRPHLKFMYYQYDLLLAAKEAYVTAESVLEMGDDHTLEPLQISQKKLELDSTIRKLFEEGEKRMYSETSKRIVQLWESREWESLLSMLKAKINSNDPQSHKQTDRIVMHAFENFLNGKKDYLDKMLKEDRSGLLVLRGLWKIKRQDVTAGLCDVQTAVWNGIHLECLLKAAIDVAVDLTDSDISDSLNQRFKVIFSGIKHSSARDLLRSAIDSNLFGLLPTDEDLIPPSTLSWPELVVPGINARATRKYEESVRRHISEGKWSERNAAVAYIDLVSSSNHPAEAVVSFVIAGLWFLKELQLAVENQESQAAERQLAGNTKSDSIKSSGKDSRPSDEFHNVFAIEQAVVGCMKQAYLLATTVLHPGMQLYVFRLALKATVSAVHLVNERATPEDGTFIVSILHSLLYVCRMNPFWNVPVVMVSEAVILNIISGKLHSQYVVNLQSKKRKPLRDAELKYQIYENDLLGICHTEAPDLRFSAMQEALREKGWTCLDVSRLMTSPLSARDNDGWLVPSDSLGVPLPYSELRGFSLKIDSDEDGSSISILVKMADGDQNGLFGPDDVSEVLSFKSGGSFFSLEPPSRKERFHPFQEFRYEPEELKGTDFLHTMFETDYLLKSFSVGVEVSATSPFNQRSTDERLLQNLPAHLRQILKPMLSRGSVFQKTCRFWIQADELVYSETHDSTGSCKKYHLENPKIVVRTHPLIRDIDGKLQDASVNDDYESPEAQFAADFTTHYDEIARYFPLFARLKELVKLQFFAAVVHSILENLERESDEDAPVPDSIIQTIQEEQRRKQKEALLQGLPQIKSQIGVWPAAENEFEVISAVRRIENELPFSYSRLYVPDADIELEVKKVLRERDQKVLSDITRNLMQVCRSEVSFGILKTMVSRWLSSNASTNSLDNLVQFIDKNMRVFTRAKIQQKKANELKAAHRSFKKEVSVMKRRKQRKEPSVTACKWVPAALLRQPNSKRGFCLCYGGVLLTPTCREGVVAQTDSRDENIQTISSRNIHTFIAASNDQVKSNRSSYTALKSYRQGLVAQTNSRDKNIQTIGSRNIHMVRVPAVSKGQVRSTSSSSHCGARTLKSKESVRSGSSNVATVPSRAAAATVRSEFSNVATVPPRAAAATVRSGSSYAATVPPRAAAASGGGRSDGNGENVIKKPSMLSKLYWKYGKSLCKSKLSLTDMPGCLTSFLKHSFQEICEQVETSLSDALPNPKKDNMLTVLGGKEKHFQMFVAKLLRCRLSSTRHELLLGNTVNSLIVPQDNLLSWSDGFEEWMLKSRNFAHWGRPDFVIATTERGGGVSYTILELKVCHRLENVYSYFAGKNDLHSDEHPKYSRNGVRVCQSETLVHLLGRAENQVREYSKWWSSMLKDNSFFSTRVFYQVVIGVLDKQLKGQYLLSDVVTSERKLYGDRKLIC